MSDVSALSFNDIREPQGMNNKWPAIGATEDFWDRTGTQGNLM